MQSNFASQNFKLTDKINSVEKLMSMWTRERGKYAMDIFVHVNSIKLHSSNLLEGSGIQH